MAPFRDKSVIWDGDGANGKYVDKGGFKYDIVSKTIVKTPFGEDMPRCFLANSPKEAEAIYLEFEKTLNSITYSYSVSTGLDKSDLFGEALIGLARASRDWDPKRSDNFKSYALFIIKDTLNEFVRNSSASIAVPSYIKKANSNLVKIKYICEQHNVCWETVVYENKFPVSFEKHEIDQCHLIISNISRAAERAGVKYSKFIERIELIPEDIEFVNQSAPETHKREMEIVEASLIVEKLKEYMDDDELAICERIMADLSFEQIGAELNRTKAWVSTKLSNLKKKILSMMEDETL